MNITIFTGNIGNDAEVRQLDNGRQVIAFSVGSSKSYTNQQGEKITTTTWYNCSKWVNSGQSTKIAEYLTKGTKVAIEGEVSARAYMKDDKPCASLELNVKEIELLGKANNESAQSQQPSGVVPSDQEEDDKLPF